MARESLLGNRHNASKTKPFSLRGRPRTPVAFDHDLPAWLVAAIGINIRLSNNNAPHFCLYTAQIFTIFHSGASFACNTMCLAILCTEP
jgi:hypothetical protein